MPQSNEEHARDRIVALWKADSISDENRSKFEEECRRQAALIAKADREDTELMAFMDAVFDDWAAYLDDWE